MKLRVATSKYLFERSTTCTIILKLCVLVSSALFQMVGITRNLANRFLVLFLAAPSPPYSFPLSCTSVFAYHVFFKCFRDHRRLPLA